MAINRELSQFGRLVEIIDGVHIGIGTTSNVSIGFGTITATTFSGNHTGSGTNLTGIVTSISAGSGISIDQSTGNVTITATGGPGGSQTLDDTLQLGNTSSFGMSVGVVTATYFVGDGSLLTNVPGSVNSGYANTAGIATYASTAGVSTYASSSGVSTYASSSGIATYATSSGIATYATSSGIATYSTRSGIATYATSSGIATYATTAGIATVAQGLTGTPNLNVGIVTATSFIGNGSGLTGIVATGSDVVIQEDGSTVGTANTINFVGTAVTATFSGGVATINITSGSSTPDISPVMMGMIF